MPNLPNPDPHFIGLLRCRIYPISTIFGVRTLGYTGHLPTKECLEIRSRSGDMASLLEE